MNRTDDAFQSVDRADFLPSELRGQADVDSPIPIGYGQTNSQPTTVRRMLEWLNPQQGCTVLDVGSGSGWTTALLAYIVGSTGEVYAVELFPELLDFGKNNCQKAGVTNAQFFPAGEKFGLPDHAPYDRILVSAATDSVPIELVDQLVINGKMVVPVGNDILEITKRDEHIYDAVRHPGYAFVPLISK